MLTRDGKTFETDDGPFLWFIGGGGSSPLNVYKTQPGPGRLLYIYRGDEIVDARHLWPGETSGKVFCDRLGPFLSEEDALVWYYDDLTKRAGEALVQLKKCREGVACG